MAFDDDETALWAAITLYMHELKAESRSPAQVRKHINESGADVSSRRIHRALGYLVLTGSLEREQIGRSRYRVARALAPAVPVPGEQHADEAYTGRTSR